ncbi:ribonuclease P protein component [Parapedobacter composti]|uniref:Ribonuclease P protein component n=1 Tax=Parapedobacter composti TaxID=623281 RepID=A0A1I1H3A5_9SPHI|nr:ribonuclease P protein component [Parapedobacter composti]SFC15933.1 ribonuclease P protein component [Parapedobacter composti]
MMERHRFPKEERLCSKRLIERLFHHGSSFFIYPYRVTFLRVDGLNPKVQVLLSAAKRRFPHAVQRNRLKRRMREAYRLQKNGLLFPALEKHPYGLALAIQYVGDGKPDYGHMYRQMAEVMKKLQRENP